MKSAEEERSALTARSVSAVVFGAAVIQPVIIYMTLVGSSGLVTLSLITYGGAFGTGYGLSVFTALASQILWIVLVIWTELANMLGTPLSKQEVYLIYAFYPVSISTSLMFLWPIYNLYAANSYIAEQLGLAQHIPSWIAPRGSEAMVAFIERSFLVPGMVVPVTLAMTYTLLGIISNFSLGLFAYQRFVVTEKLQFPAYSTMAEGIVAISGEGAPNGKRTMMVSAVGGFAYCVFSFLLPTVTNVSAFQFLPRGISDFTYLVETRLPGSMFGIDLTLLSMLVGFMVPLKILAIMGAVGVFQSMVGNPLLLAYRVWPDWAPNMGLGWDWVRSSLYFWNSVTIGLSLSAFVIPLLLHPKAIVRIFSSMRGDSGRPLGSDTESISPRLLLGLYFASTIASVLIFYVLVPDFPIWIVALFTIGGSFFVTMLTANSAGLTWGGFYVPYLTESVIYFSGYRGLDAWMGRGYMMLSNAGGWAGTLLMKDVCRTSLKDYMRGYVLASGLAVLFGFLYMSVFWRSAPIPSFAYPFTVQGWPVIVLEDFRWTKWLWEGLIFKPDVILASFVVGAVVYAATEVVLHAPYVLISLVTGLNTLPSLLLAQLMGGIAARYVGARLLGEEGWKENRALVVAGIGIGDGLRITLGTVGSLVARSMWLLPY